MIGIGMQGHPNGGVGSAWGAGGQLAQYAGQPGDGESTASPTTEGGKGAKFGRRATDQRPATMPNGKQPTYRPYDLTDWRKMPEDVKAAKVSQNRAADDSDYTRGRRDMRKKALEYAQNNNQVNMVVLAAAEDNIVKKPVGPSADKHTVEKQALRTKAQEYAKAVPKPKVKKAEPAPEESTGAAKDGDVEVPPANNELLLELEARHKKDQEMIESIKRQLKMS